jgi:hypothetical protein
MDILIKFALKFDDIGKYIFTNSIDYHITFSTWTAGDQNISECFGTFSSWTVGDQNILGPFCNCMTSQSIWDGTILRPAGAYGMVQF